MLRRLQHRIVLRGGSLRECIVRDAAAGHLIDGFSSANDRPETAARGGWKCGNRKSGDFTHSHRTTMSDTYIFVTHR